ncbi:hypothetical protein CPC1998_0003B, partial [Chlamydia psittaci C19/98]
PPPPQRGNINVQIS